MPLTGKRDKGVGRCMDAMPHEFTRGAYGDVQQRSRPTVDPPLSPYMEPTPIFPGNNPSPSIYIMLYQR